MTPQEKNIVRSLIAVAWADGRMEATEATVVEGLLAGFDASEEEERELLEYARVPRSLENDLPLESLSSADRGLLLSNAALLTMADGEESAGERAVLGRLAELLGFTPEQAARIVADAQRDVPGGSSGA